MHRPPQMRVIPIKCEARFTRFDLSKTVYQEIRRNRESLRDFDILIVSSKYAAISEGRTVKLENVVPTQRAKSLALSYGLNRSLAQLVLEESDEVLGGVPGFALSLTNGLLVPNAGIDFSNVPAGCVVLYPEDPPRTVNKLRRALLTTGAHIAVEKHVRRLGVILSDSRTTPTRLGTIGVAIAVAGIRSTIDMRGKKDLLHKELKVTIRALADQLASAAEVLMSEADESIPLVIVRGVKSAFEAPRSQIEVETNISPKKCLIVSGLRNGFRREFNPAQAFDTSTVKSETETL